MAAFYKVAIASNAFTATHTIHVRSNAFIIQFMSYQVHSPRTAHVRSNHLMRPTQFIPIIQPHASEGQDQIMVGSCLGHTGVKRSIIEHQLTVG